MSEYATKEVTTILESNLRQSRSLRSLVLWRTLKRINATTLEIQYPDTKAQLVIEVRYKEVE